MASIQSSFSLLATAGTFTAQQTFTGQVSTGAIITQDVTVKPNAARSTSASMFLDNTAGQIWEFFNNAGGSFGVFDDTNSKQPLTINANPAASALTINTANVSTGTLLSVGAGTTTAPSAPIITSIGATSGNATQLSDTTRDYMVYLEVTTAGTATSVTMGHTSSANDVTILSSVAVAAGDLFSFRLPAGWWFKWTGTTTAIGNQNAVGC